MRLALVCYGGVSLAVYMHGITKELQKLARASKTLHQPDCDVAAGYLANADDLENRETDSESVYFELLSIIKQQLNLRVIVDVASGASAGGINALMLSRAISFDLPLDAHRDMWLKYADVTELMDQSRLPKAWNKWYMTPLVQRWSKTVLKRLLNDKESQEKLSLLVRSTWFREPFSGAVVTQRLLEAFDRMGKQENPKASLIPPGHKFECLISVTDLRGYPQTLSLHDPKDIQEREHRHIWKFSHYVSRHGENYSDMTWRDIPGLVLAARASSSYAGAFPPLRLQEMTNVLKKLGRSWERKPRFLKRNLHSLIANGIDPEDSYFVDGGILNNKPFGAAIASLRTRPAQREVDRRVIFIEPAPKNYEHSAETKDPGFFGTIRAAVSGIPRNQPIVDEIQSIDDYARRAEDIQEIVASCRNRVAEVVGQLVVATAELPPRGDNITHLRKEVAAIAQSEAGYTYTAYRHLRFTGLVENLTSLLQQQHSAAESNEPIQAQQAKAADLIPPNQGSMRRIRDLLRRSAASHKLSGDSESGKLELLFDNCDLNYRRRRIRFVLRALNKQLSGVSAAEEAEALRRGKRELYNVLDQLEDRIHHSFYGEKFQDWFQKLSQNPDATTPESLTDLLEPLLGLRDWDKETDRTMAQLCSPPLSLSYRRELLNAYIGFSFYDIATLPLVQDRALDESEPIKVDRISPDDANSLVSGGASECLKGTELGHFGAFFSRAHRENDYLWGRLHAAERLVDIVLTGAPEVTTVDSAGLKKRLFQAILDSESPHLSKSDELLAELTSKIEVMGSNS